MHIFRNVVEKIGLVISTYWSRQSSVEKKEGEIR
jgi:hypothetical protein